MSLVRGFEPEWASGLLRKMNIPFNKLVQEYNQVYLKKDIKWAENSSRFINAIYSLIELFTKAPNATNDSDKYWNLQRLIFFFNFALKYLFKKKEPYFFGL